MIRWASLLIIATGCAASPPAARLFAPGTGECTAPKGCEVPLEGEPKFASPDDSREIPNNDPNLGPEEKVAAGCNEVALSVAAIEVGNYADDETLRPAVTRYRARCQKTRLTADERQCVFDAADATGIAWCAPRFWPQQTVEIVAATECPAIASQITERMNALGRPHQDLGDRQVAALQRSCQEDRWPTTLATCARNLQYAIYFAPYCAHLAPQTLRLKIEDRMAKVQ
jgi:hypothetical protein